MNVEIEKNENSCDKRKGSESVGLKNAFTIGDEGV
jgi:hypothetical protein